MPNSDSFNNHLPDYHDVVLIVKDAGGKLTGKTRLQKAACLLELAGVGSGFEFDYWRFGPYSESLANATEIAVLLGDIDENITQEAWGDYSTFTSVPLNVATNKKSRDNSEIRTQLLELANSVDSVILELATTAAFLSAKYKFEDPWKETENRKPLKSSSGRLEKAKEFYHKLKIIVTPLALPSI